MILHTFRANCEDIYPFNIEDSINASNNNIPVSLSVYRSADHKTLNIQIDKQAEFRDFSRKFPTITSPLLNKERIVFVLDASMLFPPKFLLADMMFMLFQDHAATKALTSLPCPIINSPVTIQLGSYIPQSVTLYTSNGFMYQYLKEMWYTKPRNGYAFFLRLFSFLLFKSSYGYMSDLCWCMV